MLKSTYLNLLHCKKYIIISFQLSLSIFNSLLSSTSASIFYQHCYCLNIRCFISCERLSIFPACSKISLKPIGKHVLFIEVVCICFACIQNKHEILDMESSTFLLHLYCKSKHILAFYTLYRKAHK